MESGLFWICSPKWVSLTLASLGQAIARAGVCHRLFLYSNSLTHKLRIFSAASGDEVCQKKDSRICICASVGWKPSPWVIHSINSRVSQAAGAPVQTHALTGHGLISVKIVPQIIRLHTALVWLLHQTFMVSFFLVTTPPLKILKVIISLPHFISPLHHLCGEVGTNNYNLGSTNYRTWGGAEVIYH